MYHYVLSWIAWTENSFRGYKCICDQKKTSSQAQGEFTVHVLPFSLIFTKESALDFFNLKLQVQEEDVLSPMVSIVLLSTTREQCYN